MLKKVWNGLSNKVENWLGEVPESSVTIPGTSDIKNHEVSLAGIGFGLGDKLSKTPIGAEKGIMDTSKASSINYENDYELICDSVIVSYDDEGNFIFHKDIYKPAGFDELISKYKKEK